MNSTEIIISAGLNLLMADGKSASVISTKGRWVKIQNAADGVESNISFAEARASRQRFLDFDGFRFDEAADITNAEVTEMLEPAAQSPLSMIAALINFQGVETPATPKEENAERCNGKVKAKYLPKYERTLLHREGEIIRSLDNGDPIAVMLRGVETLEEMYETVAAKIGVAEDELKAKYGHLNTGMQRMNLGNRLRTFIRKSAAK